MCLLRNMPKSPGIPRISWQVIRQRSIFDEKRSTERCVAVEEASVRHGSTSASRRSLMRDCSVSAADLAPPDGRALPNSTPTRPGALSYVDRSAGRAGSCHASPARASRAVRDLGMPAWAVERTGAWFNHVRPLPVRYGRRADIDEAFTSLITLNPISRFRSALSARDRPSARLTIGRQPLP